MTAELEVALGLLAAGLGSLVLPGLVCACRELIKDEVTHGVPRLSALLLRAAANRFNEPTRARHREEYQANLEREFADRTISGFLYAAFTYCVSTSRARAPSAVEEGEEGEDEGRTSPPPPPRWPTAGRARQLWFVLPDGSKVASQVVQMPRRGDHVRFANGGAAYEVTQIEHIAAPRSRMGYEKIVIRLADTDGSDRTDGYG
jgi:hypothetical protein